MPLLFAPPPEFQDEFTEPEAVLGTDITIDDLICQMDKENINGIFGFYQIHDFIIDQAIKLAKETEDKYPGRIVTFVLPVPTIVAPEKLDKILDSNDLIKGYGEIALYSQIYADASPDDPIFLETYKILKKHDVIVMIHPKDIPKSQHLKPLSRAIELNPDVKFLMHGCNDAGFDCYTSDITKILENYPNAYYSLDTHIFSPTRGAPYMYDDSIHNKEQFISKFRQTFVQDVDKNLVIWKEMIEKYPDQVMWGMDRAYPWHFNEEVGGLLVEYSRAFIGGLDPEVQEKYAYKNAEQMLSVPKQLPVETTIPDWIKNNAGWWAAGNIDDDSFLNGISYLIQNDIIVIPPTDAGTEGGTVPEWVKNTAGWWADGTIDDGTFVNAIQYLIKEGLIQV
jgi:predicted TIM-barrel fold metal-dependent hydrolase